MIEVWFIKELNGNTYRLVDTEHPDKPQKVLSYVRSIDPELDRDKYLLKDSMFMNKDIDLLRGFNLIGYLHND